jgi:hypothetical protein
MLKRLVALAAPEIVSPVSKTIRSSLKNTVSPAGINKFFTIAFVSLANTPLLTKFNCKVHEFIGSSAGVGVPVLLTTIKVTALTPELVYSTVSPVVVSLVLLIAILIP